MTEKIVLLASDCLDDKIPLPSSLNDKIACINFKGLKSVASKVHPNEDSGAIVIANGKELMIVADAHWGKEASEYVVSFFIEQFENILPNKVISEELVAKWSSNLSEGLINNLKGVTSETGVLLALTEMKNDPLKTIILSIGDCYAYRITANDACLVNKKYSYWIGSRSAVRRDYCDISTVKIAQGDILILATDGLPECIYGQLILTSAEIGEQVRNCDSAYEMVKILMALSQEKGGEDNCCIAIRSHG
jgi:serine/threonine protein phosphatase PrpC